jgi:hypothetical protein
VDCTAAKLPPPMPLRELAPSLPAALADVVACCLEERVEKRFRTMPELQRALESVLVHDLQAPLEDVHAPALDAPSRIRATLVALVQATSVGEGIIEPERRFLVERARALGAREEEVEELVAEALAQAGRRVVRFRTTGLARRPAAARESAPREAYADSPAKRAYDLAVYQLMKDIHEVFEEAGLRYYAIGGTLIGAVRHGGLVPWDDDLDIAIANDDIDRFASVIPRLEGVGYDVFHWEDFNGWKIERRFDLPEVFGRRHRIFCDLFCSRTGEDGQLRYTGGWHHGWNYPIAPAIVFPRSIRRFGALSIWCPAAPEGYLDIEIGGGWRTDAVRYNHHFPELMDFEARPMRPEDYLPAGPFGPLEERVYRR